MRVFARHRFDAYGPVCGAKGGVNAADFQPAEITCRRCRRIPPESWRWPQRYEVRDGSVFLTQEQKP
jgi:hypothetical protein